MIYVAVNAEDGKVQPDNVEVILKASSHQAPFEHDSHSTTINDIQKWIRPDTVERAYLTENREDPLPEGATAWINVYNIKNELFRAAVINYANNLPHWLVKETLVTNRFLKVYSLTGEVLFEAWSGGFEHAKLLNHHDTQSHGILVEYTDQHINGNQLVIKPNHVKIVFFPWAVVGKVEWG